MDMSRRWTVDMNGHEWTVDMDVHGHEWTVEKMRTIVFSMLPAGAVRIMLNVILLCAVGA